ncbi:hypothetical protein [Alkalihalobacterium elongatum]|uniref:hypothetical protein n=1 Tax=Alkalihalobacterium elongatum TaxID=2675466 RepID=UPI001C1FB0C4|nr:hypothetical protein [Alkalihalobacterium elongatum]
MLKDDFEKWLSNNTKLSTSTIGKYSGAINTISSELNKYRVLDGSLYNITDPTIVETMTVKYLSIPECNAKDIRGNRMYSNALKYLKRCLEHDNY